MHFAVHIAATAISRCRYFQAWHYLGIVSLRILGIDKSRDEWGSRPFRPETSMDGAPRSLNRLLANLSPTDFELVEPHLRTLELARTIVVATAGEKLKDAYFPHSGIISLVVRLVEGETTEVAMVGRDSVFGASAAMTGPVALATAIVRSPGTCSVLSVERLRAAADQSKTFRTTLLLHEQAIFVQARQAAACVAAHPAVARLAHGLLRARDTAGSDQLHLSQESLCEMLGVKRNVASVVAGILLDKGLIRASRGEIRIIDVARLKAAACECYETVRDELEHLKTGTLH
jgi:CRP-like cAMP-binding protein